MPELRNPNLDSQGRGGGSGSGGDFRSLITFTFLALALLLAFQFFKPKQEPPTTQQQAQQQAAQPAAPGTASVSPASSAPAAIPAISAAAETETTVENELYRIVFTNRGAQVKHWILKKYTDSAGKPLDLVQPQLAQQFGLPLSFFTYEPALTTQLNQALYQPSTTGSLLAPGSLTFHFAGNGLDVVKSFHFDSSYVIGIDTTVLRNGQSVRALVSWPAGLGDQEEYLPSSSTRSSLPTQSEIVTSVGGKQTTVAAGKVAGNATAEQAFDYAAVADLYFGAVFLPTTPAHATVVTFHNAVDIASNLSDSSSQKKPSPVVGLAMGDTSGAAHLRLFAGPKQSDVLKTVHAIGSSGSADGPSLEPLIQYGMWTIIAKPLYFALRWLHDLFGQNAFAWGWSIIVFTTLFNLIMLPTRFMMMRSSLRMMRIQPEVDKIKRKYANLKINDPKRAEMNTEMMDLYKRENVNVYGSCLPMLPQLPLFFAYFKVLQCAVELRQAHWFWLKDLATPDPLHILPILIILTMFLTQYITPSPGMDPAQRRMMAFIMPVFMGFILFNYASGLALYWGTSNVINLAMQLGINQSSMGKEMHAIAARRALKKAGGPATIKGRK
ncbi:MAG: membrane protein insertase YidC [Terracidiphilus sp.]|nr:membrane protein insertase YidC [Terracidiphilus sp.]